MADLAVVKPVISCESLGTVDLARVTGAATRISASVVGTAKGEFCAVKGTIAPEIGFEVYLPVARWTQRYVQVGCGGLCGSINASIGQAGTCLPATEGEFVLAASDLGHQGRMGSPTEGDFAADPQKRIDFAYRGNHLTALAAKALIAAYYGQPQRYAYFSGCSDGGREALMEAQRYPDDFDGISAGAPAMMFQVQNSFWHAWTTAANLRSDGSRILTQDRLPVLHAAVLAQCDKRDGLADGLIADPQQCQPMPPKDDCTPENAKAGACLTAEEWAAALRLYRGPVDEQGNRFLPGGAQPGSEMQWAFVGQGRRGGMAPPVAMPAAAPPMGPAGGAPGSGMLANMSKVVYRDPKSEEAQAGRFPFTTAQFARVSELHPLNDATDPDLGRFARGGGKLIMWHGWSDTSIAPMISVAYRDAVRRTMGAKRADAMLRLFMIPGVSHCGGGDGFPQIDTLSPLMAWVEKGRAPAMLVAGRTDAAAASSGGPDGRGGGPGAVRVTAPFAQPARTTIASRPIYPYPLTARYLGTGDPGLVSSYAPARPKAIANAPWYGARLLRPGFHKDYEASAGMLTEAAATSPAS